MYNNITIVLELHYLTNVTGFKGGGKSRRRYVWQTSNHQCTKHGRHDQTDDEVVHRELTENSGVHYPMGTNDYKRCRDDKRRML